MGVAIRDIVADYKTPVTWDSLPGVAAIDANNALYQFLTIIRQPDGTPLMDRQGRVTSHLSGILFRVSNFMEKGIKPVFVFDGKPAALKQTTIDGRRKIRDEAGEKWKEAIERGDEAEAYKQARSSSRVDTTIIETSKELLRFMGLPTIQAPGEGEAQAAYMVTKGEARYVVSQDYDTLLFGAPNLVRNLTVSGKRKIRGRQITVNPERLILTDVLEGLKLTREQLIEIGILVGTDFNPGVEGIGAKTGLKIVQRGEFMTKVHEKLPDFDPAPVMDLFLHPDVTDDYTLVWGHPDITGIKKMLCGEYDFSEETGGESHGEFLRQGRAEDTRELVLGFSPDYLKKWGVFPTRVSPVMRSSEISPVRAPIFSWIRTCPGKKPVKPPVSVRVENTPNFSPVSQNTAGLHLTFRLVQHFKSSSFLPHSLPIGTCKPCQNTNMRLVFSEDVPKKGFW